MEDYIEVLLSYITDDRLTPMSCEQLVHMEREDAALAALTSTFTEEQHQLFHAYDRARGICDSDSGNACARAAFLLAKEIYR